MNAGYFSPGRFWAVVVKEFIQMRRDRLTFAMMIGIPLIQLTLFGFAINSDPRHLPTAVLSGDNSVFSRSVVTAMQNSSYFDVLRSIASRAEAQQLLSEGEIQFVLTVPEQFGRRLIRGEKPVLLLEADATDPAAAANAMTAFREIVSRSVYRELKGPLADLLPGQEPVTLRIHADYNPEGITQYNIVPGLMGVILTLTLVIITGLAITRESERGTMENLLSTPVKPIEVMIGKILPYILVGYIQILLILTAAKLLFHIPMQGSLPLVFALSLLFIGANLTVGVTFSTVAKNQLQAMQMTIFFFLPSILLSGFMFPFRGMPEWAQCIGQILPLTHYLRIVRGILLKGNGLAQSWPHIWPILLFWGVVLTVGVKRYRRTLD
ncbi:MAG: mannose-1-phosphate guanyltransferase [Desulfobacteraceae bacterium IS3]|nr:MAG: mannose-1-phosphate guanyltransferase [Desulfobacteraceae bacterium IS3]